MTSVFRTGAVDVQFPPHASMDGCTAFLMDGRKLECQMLYPCMLLRKHGDAAYRIKWDLVRRTSLYTPFGASLKKKGRFGKTLINVSNDVFRMDRLRFFQWNLWYTNRLTSVDTL